MKREPENATDPANDPVWDLLRQAPRHQAGPRFVDDTLRAARLAKEDKPWWRQLWMPLSLGGLATAGTAAFAIFLMGQQPQAPATPPVADATPTHSSALAELDDLMRTEALSVAAEFPAKFTDAELVSLIAY